VKLLYLITRTDEIGGAQVHVRDLARRLAADGHEVAVASGPGMADAYRGALEKAGVVIDEVPHLGRAIRPRADLAALGEITALLRNSAPDLVSLHSSKAGWLGRIAARRAGVPCVFTAHGWSFTAGVPRFRAWVYRLAERATASFCARIITVSEADRRLAIGARVARPEQVVTVHNGMPDVPPELRRATGGRAAGGTHGGAAAPGAAGGLAGAASSAVAARAEHPALEGAGLRLLMVARFSEQKDHPTLLEAMARLARESAEAETGVRVVAGGPQGAAADPAGAPVELLLVGDGPAEYAVRRLAYDLGIEDRVRFLGSRDDVAELMAASDVYVLASNWEGLPRSIIEALRAGLPVVATELAGTPELVTHGDNGYLVERGDIDELAEMLARLISDAGLRARMGARSRERYEAEFSFERMYRRTVGVYESVLGSVPGGAV
jgi:glycosyltransferase involved in cell wall biosynthesis